MSQKTLRFVEKGGSKSSCVFRYFIIGVRYWPVDISECTLYVSGGNFWRQTKRIVWNCLASVWETQVNCKFCTMIGRALWACGFTCCVCSESLRCTVCVRCRRHMFCGRQLKTTILGMIGRSNVLVTSVAAKLPLFLCERRFYRIIDKNYIQRLQTNILQLQTILQCKYWIISVCLRRLLNN